MKQLIKLSFKYFVIILLLGLVFTLTGCGMKYGAVSDISAIALASKYNQATEIKSKYQLENTALKMVAKNDPKDMVRVTIGNEVTGLGAEGEFEPSVKISRWDEVSMKIKPTGLDLIASKDKKVSFDGDKIKYETPDTDYLMYELPATEGLKEGGFEYEIDLKSKPASNVVTLDIETQGLDFYYQHIPSAEELASTTRRVTTDEKIWGSYAIYASEQKNNYVNGKLYKTGKVGQIYRPKIEDNDGKWTWGELKIDKEKGILLVTIPQEFLDKAVYPIKHATGLTFGYTTTPTSGQETITTNALWGGIFASPSDLGTVTSITGHLQTDDVDSIHAKGVIVLASTKNIVANGTTDAITLSSSATWTTKNFSTAPTMSASTNYALCYVSEGFAIYLSYDDGGTDVYDNDNSYSSPQNPTDWSSPVYSEKFGVYITYTTGEEPPASTYCGHTGGDWIIKSDCYISSNTTTNGTIYLYETGHLYCIDGAVIQAQGIQGKKGTKIDAEKSCKLQFWDFK